MEPEPRQLPAEAYTVGWICNLGFELEAAKMMLDEKHQPNIKRAQGDPNVYVLGTMYKHNVVLTLVSGFGKVEVAIAATWMTVTFKSIRFALLVGIGGGVPSRTNDVRLGDVVISQPSSVNGGVASYDFGKILPDGFLARNSALSPPPRILRSALDLVQANVAMGKSHLAEYLSALSLQSLQFSRNDTAPDYLFTPTYNHVMGGEHCERCDPAFLIPRPNRLTAEPHIHFGTIASGDSVIKDAIVRDKISAALGGVLCIEMGAAGLVNNFPCLVIRGICDYADSHRNKSWQKYAAGTATAVAKELLSATPPLQDNRGVPPLDRAAQAGNLAEVTSLLAKGADANTRDVKGWTALHYAVANGKVDIVQRLLGWGADDSLETSSGKSARDLARDMKQTQVLAILDEPPVPIPPSKTGNVQGCPQCEDPRKAVCESFYPRVEFNPDGETRDHWVESKKSIYEIIYGDDKEFWKRSSDAWTWLYLPANNMLWVKDSVRKLCHVRGKKVDECKAILDFIDASLCKRGGMIPQAPYREPTCLSDGKDMISLVLPYIDMDSEQYLKRESMTTSKQSEKMQSLVAEYDSDIYASRTLAQSYYETRENTPERDKKQIVYQHTKPKGLDMQAEGPQKAAEQGDQDTTTVINQQEDREPAKTPTNLAKLLMVNHLWMWKIDKDTIITASPERWYDGDEITLQQAMLKSRPEKTIKSLVECVKHIVARCINFSEEPYKAGLDDLYATIFSYSVAEVSFAAHKCYEEWDSSIKPGIDTHQGISREVELIQTIRDVREDLHMLKAILVDQNEVAAKLSKVITGPDTISEFGTDHQAERLRRLDENAERLEKSLNHLLDWKQKQSDLREAISAREQATNAARQGQYILVFTVVTIIFAPLSFMAALFVVPIAEYPRDDKGGVSMTGNWVGTYITAGELATLGVVACIAYIATHIPKLRNWLILLHKYFISSLKWLRLGWKSLKNSSPWSGQRVPTIEDGVKKVKV